MLLLLMGMAALDLTLPISASGTLQLRSSCPFVQPIHCVSSRDRADEMMTLDPAKLISHFNFTAFDLGFSVKRCILSNVWWVWSGDEKNGQF